MPGWKNIFSDSEDKKRAAAFEAQMLAQLAKDKAAVMDQPAAPVVPGHDGIQIIVTANGQTTHYNDLAAIPAPVRQRILKAWGPAAPPMPTQPVIPNEPPPPAPRRRSRRVAWALNLFLPGAGQFYLGQTVAGSVYALGFIACFVASMVIFVRGYGAYLQLSTGGDILETGNIERLTQAFHTGLLGTLQVVGIVIYIASAVHLSRSRPPLS